MLCPSQVNSQRVEESGHLEDPGQILPRHLVLLCLSFSVGLATNFTIFLTSPSPILKTPYPILPKDQCRQAPRFQLEKVAQDSTLTHHRQMCCYRDYRRWLNLPVQRWSHGLERSQQYMKRRGYLWPRHNTLTLGVSSRFALCTKPKYDSIEKCHIACGPSCGWCSEYAGGGISDTPPGTVGSAVGSKSSPAHPALRYPYCSGF